MTLAHWFYALAGLALLIVVVGYALNLYFSDALHTQGGSPVNVDQQREERARVLRSINVHKAVSPHVRRVK